MRALHLTLKRKWFNMILSGEKKEEYRELKPYWMKRILDENGFFRKFDSVIFYEGYRKGRRTMQFQSNLFGFGAGKTKWGAEKEKTYKWKIRYNLSPCFQNKKDI